MGENKNTLYLDKEGYDRYFDELLNMVGLEPEKYRKRNFKSKSIKV